MHGSSSFRALVALSVVSLVAFAVFALDVPSRVAGLGSGNLDRLVAPTTTVAFGEPVELAGHAGRPPLGVVATPPVRVRSMTRGVRPSRGHVLVGLRLTVRNAGSTPFDVGMGLDVTVADAAGRTYRTDSRVARVNRGRVLQVNRLRPGGNVRGVVVFDVPRGTAITRARLTVGSGLTRTAVWARDGSSTGR